MSRDTTGSHMQSGNMGEINELGARLSKEIHCPVMYPAYDKNLFQCRCGVTFPLYILKQGNWDKVREVHEKEGDFE